VVTHQLQVERRTGKVRRPETDVLPLCHATKIYTTCINNITEYDSNVARPPVRPSVRYMLRNELTEHEAHDNDTLVV